MRYIIKVSIIILLIGSGCSNDKNVEPKVNKISTISPQSLRYDLPGKGIQEVHYNKYGQYLILAEKLSPLERSPGFRSIELIDTLGEKLFSIESEGDSDYIIDAAIDADHIFLASIKALPNDKEGVVVRKIDKSGQMVIETTVEEEANSSEYVLNSVLSDERVSIVSSNESVYVAVFKNNSNTFLHALDKDNLQTKWSLQVEPKIPRSAWALNGGSYDGFEQIAAQYRVYLDIDEKGNIYTAIPVTGSSFSSSVTFHNKFFGESLSTKASSNASIVGSDALVTKISPDGQRIFSIVMGTGNIDEMKDVKVYGGKIMVSGRSAITNFNDWRPYLCVHNSETGAEIFSKTYNIGANGVFFAVSYDSLAEVFYAGGAGGWSQNPDGASISENGVKILFKINSLSGTIEKQFTLSNKARQNQIRSLQVFDGFLIIAGWENGPGTHSGDSDKSLVKADGFIEVL